MEMGGGEEGGGGSRRRRAGETGRGKHIDK